MPPTFYAIRSAPRMTKTAFSIKVDISWKEDAPKIENDTARVNMIDVLLFLFLWLNMFFWIT